MLLNRCVNFCRLFKVYLRAKIIVWDLDGTLYFSPEAIIRLRSIYMNYFLSISSKGRPYFTKAEKEGNDWSNIIQRFEKISQKKLINKLESSFRKEDWVQKNPGLSFYFNKSSKSNYLFTNSSHKQANLCLEKIGIKNTSHAFKEIITLDEVPDAKPSQEAFSLLLSRIKDVDYQNILYVGDSINHDIIPASNIGFNTVFINNWRVNTYGGISYPDINSVIKDFTFFEKISKIRIFNYLIGN